MSRPAAPRVFFPALSLVAIIGFAVAMLCGQPAGMRGHSAREITIAPAPEPTVGAEQSSRVRASLDALPLAFEANQGQTDPQVKYMARGNGYTLFLTATDAVFALQSLPPAVVHATGSRATEQAAKKDLAAVRMHLSGGDPRAQITVDDELPGYTNYFIGNDKSKWQHGVKQYARVSYRNVYPGVNLAFHGQQRQMEFDFLIAPGADPTPIALRFSGVREISADASGSLTVATSAGNLSLHPPVAYQERNGSRKFVDARFVLKPGHQIGFALGTYDHSRELVIDPSVSYATYLGGVAGDEGLAIAIDGNGDAYITGDTGSTNFPVVTGDYSTHNAGGSDAFVTKLAANGASLVYSTYVGGSGNDTGNAIVVNSSGDAYVAGQTASTTDFPHTTGALQTSFGGGGLDAFVFELNSAGTGLIYSTYLGGSGDDIASGIALNRSMEAYIVGSTTSTNFPTHDPKIGTLPGQPSGFVTKLNSSGSALVYSTYLGGGAGDFASAVAVDSSDQAYVTGATQNSSFPTTQGAFQTSCGTSANCNGGLADAFVTVFKSDGSGYVYSTFLGGEASDQGFGIAVDSSGDAYVTGATASTHFPLKGAIRGTLDGPSDAFVTAFNPTGSALLYSTYLGGSVNETGTGIAIDGSNNVYVTGQTGSSDFPTVSPTQVSLGGADDAFVTEINSTGSKFLFSTYLGGSANENSTTLTNGNLGAAGAIAVDSLGSNIYVTGNTFSTDFPTHLPYQAGNAGLEDAFVVKYAQANFTITATPLNPASVDPGTPSTSTVTANPLNGFSASVALTCAVAPTTAVPPTCAFNPSSVNAGIPATMTVTTTTSTTPGTYTFTVTGTAGGFTHSTSVSMTVNTPDFSIVATALNPSAVAPGTPSTSTVTVGSLAGFSSPVALTCTVTPATANPPTCGYNSTPVTPPSVSTLTVNTNASTSGGTYNVMVTGTSGSIVHSTTLSVTVNAPDFTIAVTAMNPPSVTPGGSATSTITVTGTFGFASAVALSCSVSPSPSNAPTCGFSPNSIAPGASSTLTVTTTASTIGPSYNITVTGTSGILTHSTSVSLKVTAPDFTISGSPLAAVAQGGSTTSTITIAAVNGYKGTVNFTCSVANVTGGTPLPTCSIPNPVTNGAGTSMLTVTTMGSARAMHPIPRGMFYAMWLPIVGFSLVGMRFSAAASWRKRLLGFLLLGTIMVALFLIPACGGGGAKSCPGCTPPGTYNITVTGTDSANTSLTHSAAPLGLSVN